MLLVMHTSTLDHYASNAGKSGGEFDSERDLQDYLGHYQDLRDEWKRKRQESTDITDDVVFEIELIRQIEINIDYILMLVKKYHDTHCEDKEVLITINKAIDASPELRSKKQLIETFIAGINDVDDVMNEWHEYVVEQRDRDLNAIITEEKLSMVAEPKTPYKSKDYEIQ
jgi:type I restriction enzyme R subunit